MVLVYPLVLPVGAFILQRKAPNWRLIKSDARERHLFFDLLLDVQAPYPVSKYEPCEIHPPGTTDICIKFQHNPSVWTKVVDQQPDSLKEGERKANLFNDF